MSRGLLKRITQAYDAQKAIASLKNQPFQMPADLASPLMEYMMERSYLEEMSDRDDFVAANRSEQRKSAISWMKVKRIPIHPSQMDKYDLLGKWQSVLASLHAWHTKTIFMLERKKGETSLYIGICAGTTKEGLGLLRSALMNSMPGIEAESIDDLDAPSLDDRCKGTMQLKETLNSYSVAGAITGIPSFRKNEASRLSQTLDQLAYGIRNKENEDSDFCLLVVADPMADSETAEVIGRYQKLGGDIHSEVSFSVNDSESKSESESSTFSIAQIIGSVASFLGPTAIPLAKAGVLLSESIFGASSQSQNGVSVSRAVTKNYLNKFAQFAEKLTDMHCERLRQGRNLGFWNVGVYVLGHVDEDVSTVLGMLRSVYSGENTYIEPIRMHLLHQSEALRSIRNFQLLPLLHPDMKDKVKTDGECWHMFGECFQYLSTPLNTEELSLATSLPRRDVPGLRFVRSSVRFANNPGLSQSDNKLPMGRIMDSGVVQANEYSIDIDSLVRHSLIVGSTGCGKTTTCKTIINEVMSQGIPVLIIEPAKDEYVRWAIKQNETLPEDKKINIFMPGVKNLELYGVTEGNRALPPLKINPFQPAAIEGAPIDMLTRCEQLTALVNASLPTSDVLPVIIDEGFFSFLNGIYGTDFTSGETTQRDEYPLLDGVLPVARKILDARGYAKEVAMGLAAALDTRFKYLTRGKRGEILNVRRSTPYAKMFDQPTVINLSKIANQKDKSLIMSLLMLSLYEYRISAYTHDKEYCTRAQQNRLMHLTVVEEAHNVLTKPSSDASGTGNPQQVVADIFGNMLSEIRSYGEGLMIIDQVPTRLIDDSIRNTNYKIAHRLASREDADVMAGALGLRPDQKDLIPLLQQGQAIISCDADDAASWVKINKPQILL